MKFKLWRRRMSVSAPRMTVRTHVPLPLRLAGTSLLLAVSAALGLWIYSAGVNYAGLGNVVESAELKRLRAEAANLLLERDKLQAAANAAESRLNIERSAQSQLANQVRNLEAENVRLKDDLAFFESLSTAGTGAGVSIKRFVLEPDGVPRQMRYRVLVTQGGKPARDFTGSFQLILNLQQGGKAVIMNLPDSDPKADRRSFQISFRRYQRIEGNVVIPEGASLKQAQVRVLENGTTRAQQVLMFK